MNAEELYTMKLHDVAYIGRRNLEHNIMVVRVPGGWTYTTHNGDGGSVFVPFDNEFFKVPYDNEVGVF